MPCSFHSEHWPVALFSTSHRHAAQPEASLEVLLRCAEKPLFSDSVGSGDTPTFSLSIMKH